VVVVAFQNVFHAETHQNDIFFNFFKNKISASKHTKKLIFSKKKIEFFGNAGCTVFPNAH
jgi:hypothetical protein